MARQIVPAGQHLNPNSAQCTEALCTRECMVAHRLAVPRTAVAEFNIYVEMWGCVFYSGVAALINSV